MNKENRFAARCATDMFIALCHSSPRNQSFDPAEAKKLWLTLHDTVYESIHTEEKEP